MKRVVMLCTIGIIAALVAVSCSQRYEPPAGPTTDTLVVHDTIRDTVFQPPDTITVTDTVFITDTIRIPNDSCSAEDSCGTIEGSTKAITWLVSRTPGTYHLIFLAETEKDQPPQSVTVTVDGVATEWPVADQPKLVLTRVLGESAITVTSNSPPARGHGITICLKIKRE